MSDDLAKLRILLPHWIGHNEEHAASFREWAGKAQEMGLETVAQQIEEAVGRMAACKTRPSPPRWSHWRGKLNHRQFFDQVAADWDALEVEETHVRLREIVAGLDIVPGAAVLDMGAGTGVLVPLLLEATGGEGRITALNISGEMLRQAQAKGYPIEYIRGDAENLPLRNEAFD